VKKDAGYRLRERLQPFIEQDMQIQAELENQLMRKLAAANRRAMQPLIDREAVKSLWERARLHVLGFVIGVLFVIVAIEVSKLIEYWL
jgi:VIT1/CCC1 family predicted Fe2+/Mn2+ transporter